MFALVIPKEDYRRLLEPIGFQIERVVGIGTPTVYHADRVLRGIRTRIGDWAALPLLPIALPIVQTAKLYPRTLFLSMQRPSSRRSY